MSYLRFWPTFSTSRVRQGRPDRVEDGVRVEDLRAHRPADGQVIGDPRLPGEREADQVGPERVERGRLGVEAELGLAWPGLGGELGELLGRVDQPVVGDPRAASTAFSVSTISSRKPWNPHSLQRALSALAS